jgi:hypothetical protein
MNLFKLFNLVVSNRETKQSSLRSEAENPQRKACYYRESTVRWDVSSHFAGYETTRDSFSGEN